MKIKVNSEIGKLRKVLVHRPGLEVEKLYPEIFKHVLFDDAMYAQNAQKEHDYFVKKLKENGVEVLYIENLIAEVFDSRQEIRKQFLKRFIDEAGIECKLLHKKLYDFFNQEKNNLDFVKKIIVGVQKQEINFQSNEKIECEPSIDKNYPFFVEPLPNLLFQRDSIASIYNGISIHNMTKLIRKREGILHEYLLKYHPEWQKIKIHLSRNHSGNVEGGDILIINEKTILVGISERTNEIGVKELASKLFSHYHKLKNIIGIHIPKVRKMMHLDTIITQMDYDKFSIGLGLQKKDYDVSIVNFNKNKLKITSKKMVMENIIKKYAHPNAKFFSVGDNDIVASKVEQWNDGANCLTLEPGVVFVYDRNVKTNNVLKRAGIKLIEIPSGELSRGRGGPRCMSMPLERDAIKDINSERS